eukprot:3094825-Rhodomonas_salina.2
MSAPLRSITKADQARPPVCIEPACWAMRRGQICGMGHIAFEAFCAELFMQPVQMCDEPGCSRFRNL